MKNGLGALDRALDELQHVAVEDDIPIFDPDHIEGVVTDARAALDDVRELCRATRLLYVEMVGPLDGTAPHTEGSDVLVALDRLMKPREGTRVP